MCKSQNHRYELIDVQNNAVFKKKDSLSAVHFLDSLSQNNYYFTEVKNVIKTDSLTKVFFDKGKNFNQAQVKISSDLEKDLKLQTEFYTKNLDSLKKEITESYRKKGYSFSRIKTKYLGMNNEIPAVELSVFQGEQRKINAIVYKGYTKLPARFQKNLEEEYVGKIYEDKALTSLNASLQNHAFIVLEKPPQTLFTRDSTQVFLFTQKKKSNTFDGIIGFGNDNTEKFTFNGSLNVNFRNMFNSFETVNIFWQRNPDKGQTFDLQTDVPYLFGSNIGTNINVNIYRQDSTFATVKLLPVVYFHLDSRQKLGLRGRIETSTVTDSLYTLAKDYSKQGIGIWYRYTEPSEIELFLHKTKIQAEADYLSTHYSIENRSLPQTSFYLSAERNFLLSGNNYLNLRAEGAALNSKEDLVANELFRIGGWNSFRGFNENSLLADLYYLTSAEYRYVVGSQAFFDVFAQYGQLNNKSLNLKPKLYSFGLGFNFFLPIGLMSFQIANGNEFGNPIKLGDTKIHWGILSRF